MLKQETIERAERDKREGQSPTTQAGEFVREEMHHIREGKHGAQSTKQAIAIGLSRARQAGPGPPKQFLGVGRLARHKRSLLLVCETVRKGHRLLRNQFNHKGTKNTKEKHKKTLSWLLCDLCALAATIWGSLVKVPNGDRAVVEIAKLRDYCLNPDHLRGGHKARVFAAALELTADDAAHLQARLLEAIRTEEAVPTDQDQYGQRYVVDFTMARDTRWAVVRSAWIIRAGEDFPRLTSCYVL
jgi:hypothetical protein